MDAYYAKDAGASFANQLSVWEWEGSAPALLWIGRYTTHTEATRPVRIRGSLLSFGLQDDFAAFSACMSCDGRQLLHRLQITPEGVRDLGTSVLYPELDQVDALFVALAKQRPIQQLASADVVSALRDDVRRSAAKSAKVDPKYLSVGMLEDWSVTRSREGEENICIITDDLGRLDFIYSAASSSRGFLKSVNRTTNSSKPCPVRNAVHLPYSSAE